jgi:hypothetical protein
MSIWDSLVTPDKGTYSLRLEKSTPYGRWSWLKEFDKGVGIALEVNGDVDTSQIDSTKYFDVVKRDAPNIGSVLTIVCKDAEFYEIFEVLCRDLVKTASQANDLAQAIRLIGDRVSAWTKLFARGFKGLTRSSVYGLAAELSFLKIWLSTAFSEKIKGWVGPIGSSQDFISQIRNRAVEVKASSDAHSIVKISSLEQLDFGGDLYLAVFPISPIKEGTHFTTLDALVDEIIGLLGEEDRVKFGSLLLASGYISGKHESFRMNVGKVSFYKISSGFPRLVRAGVASEIVTARYELNLDKCKTYEVTEMNLVGIWNH